MTVSTGRLIQIAGWGGLIVASTGFYLQNRLTDKFRACDYYKTALKTLRHHPGAVHFLGEPIKDKRIKLTDTENYSDSKSARLCIPVAGTKERGKYYIWAENNNSHWSIVRAELELNSKPDQRLVIVKQKS